MFPIRKHRVRKNLDLVKDPLIQHMPQVAPAARGLGIHGRGRVASTRRTLHRAGGSAVDGARAATVEINRQRIQHDVVGAVLIIFQRPLLDGSVNQTEIIDARAFAGVFAGFDEIGDGDAGKEADNRNHNHNFNERKSRFSRELNIHTGAWFFA